MKEMYDFKRSLRENVPFPDFKGSVTIKLFLEFLCALCDWSHVIPNIRSDIEKEGRSLYVLYRDIVFCDQDFWQMFSGFLAVLSRRWQIDVFGTELFTQEAVALTLEKENGKYYGVQKTVSGEYADSISSICMRIQCASGDELQKLSLLGNSADLRRGVVVGGWEMHRLLEEEDMICPYQNSYYCYGDISGTPSQENYLEALSFAQKRDLWAEYLKSGFDFTEFEWMYARIADRILDNRTEWELALYASLHCLDYSFTISGREFEMNDGQGRRCYFNFNSSQNAQKALLKLLFPN